MSHRAISIIGVRSRGIARSLRLLLLAIYLFGLSSLAADAKTNLVHLKGRIIPLPHSTDLQFRVESGPTYKLLPTRDAQALFLDTNLQSRVLLVKGKLHPKDSALEVLGNLHAIRNGKVYELYYYCAICSIETSFPGLCLCCREPVELRERESPK